MSGSRERGAGNEGRTRGKWKDGERCRGRKRKRERQMKKGRLKSGEAR